MSEIMVLAGDIGGTKTNLALFRISDNRLENQLELTYKSQDHDSLEQIIQDFLHHIETQKDQVTISSVCFGIAGPIKNNTCQVTNLPWFVDALAIQKRFNFPKVSLINDLEANAWGISSLSEEDFIVLNSGTAEVTGNASIIAAGTGLGEAGMFWNGQQHIPFASEGGHSDFSVSNEQEFRFYQFLGEKYQSHISWERVLCGDGLVNIYQFLCQQSKTSTPTWLLEKMQNQDPASVISQTALAKQDEICQQALDWFVYFYGVEAGNQALKIMSHAGVYIGGGIAPKIIKALQSDIFIHAFFDKGRMRPLLEAMPVKVIMNDKTALYGPAIYAMHNVD